MARIWAVITVAVAVVAFWAGVLAAGTANANRISELEDEIHKSIPISVIEDFIQDCEHFFGVSVLDDLTEIVESWK